MSDWNALDGELDRWAAAGRVAEFWWRDDDATAPSPALDRLLALAEDTPLSLAVIPARATDALAQRLDGARGLRVLQHGYAHVNHAAAGAKKCELAPARPFADMAAELRAGLARLNAWPGFLPVLVPPWNRIDPALPARLPELGFCGLSAFGPRDAAPPGLRIVNTHLDPIAWRVGRGFIGEQAALRGACAELAARRLAGAAAPEPIGLLTHHAAHVESVWNFVARFRDRVHTHAGARWIGADEAFGGAA